MQDRFSNQAREASKEIRRLHQEAKNITNANLNAVNRVASIGVATGAVVGAGIVSAVKQGAQFIDTMTFVKAIAKDTGTAFSELSQRAKTLGKDTMFTSQDIGSAMQFMAMAGQGTTEIYNNITAAADLANATMSQLGGKGGAADIMTNIMKMFVIESTETNSTKVADVLTRAVTRSNTNLYDLAEAIKYAGTTTTNLGSTLEQTSAAIGVLGDAGIQGSMAGTALANAYRYLSKSIGEPNFKGGKALQKLGLSKSDFVDAQGDLIDLGLAMQKIAQASSGLGSVDQFNLLTSILGVRGERAGSTMIRAFSNYSKLLDELNNKSAGAAADIREQRMASLAGAIETVQSTWENLQTSFTEAVSPTFQPYLRAIGSVLQGLQALFDSPVGPFFAALISGATLFVTIASATTAFKSGWRLLFNDSTVSLRNMFAVMEQGWKSGTISAAQYLALQQAIIAQGKAGMVSNAAGKGIAMQTMWATLATQSPGKYFGGYMAKQDKKGAWRYYQQTPEGGSRRVTAEAVTNATKKFKPEGLLGFGAGSAATAAAAKAAAGRAAGKSVVSKAATVVVAETAGKLGFGAMMRGIGGFLGGPWGIALMTIVTFLPTLINMISGNTDAQNENTAALNKPSPEELRQKNIDAAILTTPERQVLTEDAVATMLAMLSSLPTQIQNIVPGSITVNVDGRAVVEEALNNYQLDQIINVGGK